MGYGFYIYLYYHNVIGENKVQDFYAQKNEILQNQLAIAKDKLRASSFGEGATAENTSAFFDLFATEKGQQAFIKMMSNALSTETITPEGEAISDAILELSSVRKKAVEDASHFTEDADIFIKDFNNIMKEVAKIFGVDQFNDLISVYQNQLKEGGLTEAQITKELKTLITKKRYQGILLSGDKNNSLVPIISKIVGLIFALQRFQNDSYLDTEITYNNKKSKIVQILLGKIWGLLIEAKGRAKEMATAQGLTLGNYTLLSSTNSKLKGIQGKGVRIQGNSVDEAIIDLKGDLSAQQKFGTGDVLWQVKIDKVTLNIPISIKNYRLRDSNSKTVNLKIQDSVPLRTALERSSLLDNNNFMHYFYNVAAAHSKTSAEKAGVTKAAIEEVGKIGKTFTSEAAIAKRWKETIDLIDAANLLYNLSGYSKQNPYGGAVLLIVNGQPFLIEDIIQRVIENSSLLGRRGAVGQGLAKRDQFSILNSPYPVKGDISSSNITIAANERSQRVEEALSVKLQRATITSTIQMALMAASK